MIGKAKKPFVFIKNKTVGQRNFLRNGRPGGMIAELLLSTQFFSWIVDGLTMNKLPDIFVFVLTAGLMALFAELLNLEIAIIFGGGKRQKAYFVTAFLAVGINNCIANQGNAISAAVIMTIVLILAADILGRCLWSLIKDRRFKQVFAYVAGGLSLAYLSFYAMFFHTDSWGESRIEFYDRITDVSAQSMADAAAGFDDYLCDGSYQVLTLSYGPEDEADIITNTVDYSGFDSMEERGLLEKITQLFSDYDFAKTPLRGQIWYPEGLLDCPVLFIVHGQHDSTLIVTVKGIH